MAQEQSLCIWKKQSFVDNWLVFEGEARRVGKGEETDLLGEETCKSVVTKQSKCAGQCVSWIGYSRERKCICDPRLLREKIMPGDRWVIKTDSCRTRGRS
ncbi:hypothetical protein NE237_030577 [Protea cynaroides]|uniref:Uncharacterized protein n=1 Tax=Protea cynaroides TaxID=273540 RepID=A0A9Q0GUH8_9MAGN|nr:hypothetical protein NE237_030577 [Protea cynaroides]